MNQKFTKKMFFLLLFLVLPLAGGCSNTTAPGKTPTPDGALTPVPVLTEEGTPEPTKDEPATPSPTSAEELTPTEPALVDPPVSVPPDTEPSPTPSEDTASDPSVSDPPASSLSAQNTACMYMNYSNAFPLVFTESSEVRFGFDDTVVITTGEAVTTLHLSDAISLEGADFSDPDAWYFCGAFQSGDIVYAHYDYLDGRTSSPSLLLQIDPLACTATCCICSQNPKKTFTDTFTIAGGTLYYTYADYSSNGTATSYIISTGRDGNNPTTCVACAQGETIPYMTSDGECLYFVVTGSNSTNRLVCFDPATGSQNVISSRISSVDFLAVLDGYLLTSIQNNTLRYYSQDGSAYSLKLTANASLTAGIPMTDGNYIYIPFLNYSNDAATKVVAANLAENRIAGELTLGDTFYYCIGMVGQCLYAENGDDFITFTISLEDES